VAEIRRTRLALIGLSAAGAAVIACLVGLFLIYLRVPAGWSPTTGYAPDIGPVFERAFPYPTVALPAPLFRGAVLGLILGSWIAYTAGAMGLGRLPEAEARRRAFRVVVAVAVAAHLVLVLLPPVFSTDLFRYGLFGRMVLEGDNPYLRPAGALASDPLWPYAGWRHLRSHYGAAFLWLSAGATLVGGGGPVGTALAFKAVMAAFNLAACFVVRQLARATGNGDGLTAFALYAWNPLMLMESAGGAHPEAMMIALALGGCLLWWRGRPAAGFALVVASVAVKYVTVPLALLMAVKAVAEAARGRRLATALGLVGAAALVGAALYGPFWRGGAALFATTAAVILRGRALEQGQELAPADTPALALVVFGLVLAAATFLAARAARPRVLELSAGLISLFVLSALRWKMPWYLTTALALALVAAPSVAGRSVRLVTFFLCLLAMLLYGAVVPLGSA
jgi:hypothetical protein